MVENSLIKVRFFRRNNPQAKKGISTHELCFPQNRLIQSHCTLQRELIA